MYDLTSQEKPSQGPWKGATVIRRPSYSLNRSRGSAQLTTPTYIYPEVTEEPLTSSYLVIGRRRNTLPDRTELSDD